MIELIATPKPIDGIFLGFTGTRSGVTKEQRIVLTNIFRTGNNYITALRHGMCVGADADVHAIVRNEAFWKCTIIGHPPINKKHFDKDLICDIYEEPQEYLIRNSAIVVHSHQLLACPGGEEELRSGTWSTVRKARLTKIPITIIMPDGEVRREK